MGLVQQNTFSEYIKQIDKDMVYPGNYNGYSIINEMALRNIQTETYTLECLIQDILDVNFVCMKAIAEKGLELGEIKLTDYSWIDSERDIDEIIDDIVDEDITYWYFDDEQIGTIENMVFDALMQSGIPFLATKSDLSMYELFTMRFSIENKYVEDMDTSQNIKAHVNHAQQIMFSELLEDGGSAMYGTGRMLLLCHDEIKSKLDLIGAGNE